MLSLAPYSFLIINIIASIILGILPRAYAVQLQRKWSSLTSGKLQKLSYITTRGICNDSYGNSVEMYKV